MLLTRAAKAIRISGHQGAGYQDVRISDTVMINLIS